MNATQKDKPLVVIAHSLGAQIISNYIWDRQAEANATRRKRGMNRYGRTDFERMKTLAGIVTFGCNIPLFSLAYDKIVSIEFPPKALVQHFPNKTAAAKLRKAAQWLNFYDPDDVLGYPLQPLSESYAKTVSEDKPINAGGMFSSWNPLSHSEYWTDNDFTKPVATMLSNLLRLL